ncbi:hypothetical protein GCM10010406_53060 [Streptomyces thermolineatus]|uniref:Uncharacterized protein n=1 Tax=Streptomyces thermolineatus TaxID=44033 RepID=A0ABP6A741_9ACTN
MNRKRRQALHIHEPPCTLIERLRTNVAAKPAAAAMPSSIGRAGPRAAGPVLFPGVGVPVVMKGPTHSRHELTSEMLVEVQG